MVELLLKAQGLRGGILRHYEIGEGQVDGSAVRNSRARIWRPALAAIA